MLAVGTTAPVHAQLDLAWETRHLPVGSTFTRYISVKTDADGNIYACGQTNSNGGIDAIVSKFDSAGRRLWTSIYGSPFNLDDYVVDLVVDTDGTVYAAGITADSPTHQLVMVRKIEANGHPSASWPNGVYGDGTQTYNIGSGRNTVQNIGMVGNDLIVGCSARSGTDVDLFVTRVVKSNASLSAAWPDTGSGLGCRRYDTPANLGASGGRVAADTSGNVYLVGEAFDATTSNDLVAVKFDPAGNHSATWPDTGRGAGVRHFNVSNQSDLFRRFEVTPAGVVILAGTTQAPVTGTDISACRINANGTFAWTFTLPVTGTQSLQSLDFATSGTYLGGIDSSDDSMIIKLDNNGIPSATWPSTGQGVGIRTISLGLFNTTDAVVQTGSGTVGAVLTSGSTPRKVSVVEFNPNGTIAHTSEALGGSGNYADAFAAAELLSGGIAVVGDGKIGTTTCGIVIKFSSSYECENFGIQTILGTEFSGDLNSILSSDEQYYQAFNDDRMLGTTVEIEVNVRDERMALYRGSLNFSVARPGMSYEIAARRIADGVEIAFAGGLAPEHDTAIPFTIAGNEFVDESSVHLFLLLKINPINDEDPSQDGWITSIDELQGIGQL